MTDAEVFLWSKLRSSQLGFKFRRQQSIGNYIVDFYCPATQLVIELDGAAHGEPRAKIVDRRKELFLQNNGFAVKRYTNEQLFTNSDHVLDEISKYCSRFAITKTTPNLSLERRGT